MRLALPGAWPPRGRSPKGDFPGGGPRGPPGKGEEGRVPASWRRRRTWRGEGEAKKQPRSMTAPTLRRVP